MMAIAAATISYMLIEGPFLRLKGAFQPGRVAAPATPPPAPAPAFDGYRDPA